VIGHEGLLIVLWVTKDEVWDLESQADQFCAPGAGLTISV